MPDRPYEKYKKDGAVAVLIAPGFGAGWFTWNSTYPGLVFDAELVEQVLAGNFHAVREIAKKKYPVAYLGGLDDLEVVWLPEGTQFSIEEYGGSESVRTVDQLTLRA